MHSLKTLIRASTQGSTAAEHQGAERVHTNSGSSMVASSSPPFQMRKLFLLCTYHERASVCQNSTDSLVPAHAVAHASQRKRGDYYCSKVSKAGIPTHKANKNVLPVH